MTSSTYTSEAGPRVRGRHLLIAFGALLILYGAGYATQMRFSNNGSTWSAWEPYSTAKTWTLSAGGGDKQVWAQLDTSDAGSDPNHTASDTITYNASCASTTLQNQELDGSRIHHVRVGQHKAVL